MGSDKEIFTTSIDTEAIDAAIRRLMKTAGAPGVAIAVVHGDQTYLQAYGVKTLGSDDPVTVDTLFANASTTKAFTTAALALLVDEKKMQWDDPVRKYLPSFRLDDPHADALITPRDLVTHRTGLPRHDWLWYRSNYSRDEILYRIGFAKPTASLRSTYQYNNICYTAAGEVARNVSGAESFEAFLKDRLLTPLGMIRTCATSGEVQADPNHASPHKKVKNKVVPSPFLNFDCSGACGTLNSSVREMAHWLRFQLSGGLLPDGTRLISEEALRETHKPQMVIPLDEATRKRYPFLCQTSYGLGWSVQNWRDGRSMLTHGGAIDGFRSQACLLPSEQIGIMVFVNIGQPFVEHARNTIIDILLDTRLTDWHDTLKDDQKKIRAEEKKADEKHAEEKKKRQSLPLSVGDLAGTYTEPAYGTVTISKKGRNKIRLVWNAFDFVLDHIIFTKFSGVYDDFAGDHTDAEFELDATGKVVRVKFLDGIFTKEKARDASS